ncbi:MAG: GAF domain-containing sensor histidine kinase [Chloroflexota bacterium]|jgi:signal transduction histidine kinase
MDTVLLPDLLKCVLVIDSPELPYGARGMIKQTRIALSLASLLEENQNEITMAWAEKAQKLPYSSHVEVPFEELVESLALGLAAMIEGLRTGSARAMESYLKGVALFRVGSGFDISEVLGTLLMLRDAALPVVLRAYSADFGQATLTINQLDASLRYMSTRLASLFAEGIERRLQEQQERTALLLDTSEGLQRVTRALLKKLAALDEVLAVVCNEARQLTGASGCAILLLEDEEWLRVTSNSGSPSPVLNRLAIGESLAGKVVAQAKPLILNDRNSQVQAYYKNPELESLLAIPLWADDVVIGALDVVNKPGGFDEEDIRIMSLFGDQAAIAIKNAQLHEQAEKLAVIEERQRLARELHDSVSQALYSVNLYAEAARMALSAGKSHIAADNLEALRNMAREAILDMRALIFELHPPALEEDGLASALQARLEAVEARSGLQTEFHIRGESRLPITIEEELYRIAQEALTNAVKHARAKKVIIRLTTNDDRFCLEVQDDGSGFDVSSADRSGGLGLRGIRERVQCVNGELSIDSIPGQGTTLRVTVNI